MKLKFKLRLSRVTFIAVKEYFCIIKDKKIWKLLAFRIKRFYFYLKFSKERKFDWNLYTISCSFLEGFTSKNDLWLMEQIPQIVKAT